MARRSFLSSSWVGTTIAVVLVVASSLLAADSADWKEFAPEGGKFSVQFPAKTTSGKAGSGEKEFKTERCVLNDTAYTLYWKVREQPFASAAQRDAYLWGQQYAITKNGKIIATAEVVVGSIKGREFTVTVNENMTLRCRAFVIDDVVCCTLVIQGKSPEAVMAPDPEAFFKSFNPAPKKEGASDHAPHSGMRHAVFHLASGDASSVTSEMHSTGGVR